MQLSSSTNQTCLGVCYALTVFSPTLECTGTGVIPGKIDMQVAGYETFYVIAYIQATILACGLISAADEALFQLRTFLPILEIHQVSIRNI